MKKNLINVFLSVAISLLFVLICVIIKGLCSPIRLESEYRCGSRCSLVFHDDGTFEKKSYQHTIIAGNTHTYVEEKYGVYIISDGEVQLVYLDSNYVSHDSLEIHENGASLVNNYNDIYISTVSGYSALVISVLVAEGVLILLVVANNKEKKEEKDDK